MPDVLPLETRADFLERCIPILIREEGKESDVAVAQCNGIYDQHVKKTRKKLSQNRR